jgi:hypothetical protein
MYEEHFVTVLIVAVQGIVVVRVTALPSVVEKEVVVVVHSKVTIHVVDSVVLAEAGAVVSVLEQDCVGFLLCDQLHPYNRHWYGVIGCE